MNSTSSDKRHRLIRQLSSDDDKIKNELMELLDGTAALDDFKILGDSSLYHDACSIRAIFAAVTSGSYSPSLLDRLTDIEHHSVFINWKYLILAITLLYQHRYAEALQMIYRCTPSSPQASFVKIFEKLMGYNIQLSSSQQLLYDRLTQVRPVVKEAALLLEQRALDKNEELFRDTVECYCDQLSILEPQLLTTILLYSIEVAYQYHWHIEPYHQLISQLYAKQEAYRVISLTSLASSPLDALENYIKMLKIVFSRQNNAFTIKESLKILGEIALLAIEHGYNEEKFNQPWRRLQILFYQKQNYFHLYWPQEELITTEAIILAEVKESLCTAMMNDSKKQMELFK